MYGLYNVLFDIGRFLKYGDRQKAAKELKVSWAVSNTVLSF